MNPVSNTLKAHKACNDFRENTNKSFGICINRKSNGITEEMSFSTILKNAQQKIVEDKKSTNLRRLV